MKPGLEKTLISLCWLSGFVLLGAVIILVGYLAYRGIPTLNRHLLFGDTPPLDAMLMKQQVFDGLFPAIVGTLALLAIAIIIAVPIGVAAGIYMAEYGRGPVKKLFNLLFDILAAIPSIVIGLCGLTVILILHNRFEGRFAPCLILSALSLAFLVMPYLIRTTQMALESVPPAIRLTAPALGSSKLQNILLVLLPSCLPEITGGIILATGRCAEDTAVIMLTGAVTSAGIPRSFLDQYEALPFYIYYISAQYSGPAELASGFGAALILLVICGLLFTLSFWLRRRLTTSLLYR